jgi:hypothetical protein
VSQDQEDFAAEKTKQELDMKRSFFARPLLSMAAACVTLAVAGSAGAQNKEPIYGSQLMTQRTAGISAAHSQCQVESGTATHSL